MISDYIKTLPQFLLPKHSLTTLAGRLADVKTPAIKNQLIKNFIQHYQVDMSESLEEKPENYACFNDFFTRKLKPECRPIAEAGITSPVDGYVSEIGQISAGKLLQAKGRYYTVQELLACDESESSPFTNGLFATLYLSPRDYHRVHMPLKATLKEMIYVPGKLFSVQPATVRIIPKLFASNERLVVFFETSLGLMAMILVGATVVGGIGTSWQGNVIRSPKKARFTYPQEHNSTLILEKAAEMGYFKLGSTVVLLFAQNQRVQWRNDLKSGARIRFGEALAEIK